MKEEESEEVEGSEGGCEGKFFQQDLFTLYMFCGKLCFMMKKLRLV